MRGVVIATAVLGLLLQVLGTAVAAPDSAARAHDHTSHDHGLAELPAADPVAGVVTSGLAVATDGPCAGLLEVLDVPGTVCTHGPDPAPAEIGDVRVADLDAAEAAAAVAAAPPFQCDGDGVSGRRAHAIYAVPPGRTDRFAAFEDFFQASVARVQEEYRQSSLLHGASRPLVYRFTHTTPVGGDCEPLVDHVKLPSKADVVDFPATILALQKMGYTDPSRRYLVFVDANVLCGIGHQWGDDRADPSVNYSNILKQPLFSRVDAPCWNYAETHELTHNLGGVQSTAPHASGLGHCNDDYDLMCYADGGPTSSLYVAKGCGTKSLYEFRLDCGGDDYFHPSPPAGSYLATHWNVADSSWLFQEAERTDRNPNVRLTAPDPGVVARNVTLRGRSSDPDGDLAATRVFVDGKRVATVTGNSWSASLRLSAGPHVLSALAVDDDGHTSTRRSVSVRVLHDMPSTDLFVDDDDSGFEAAIERLAVEGVTRGCNPPLNTRFCPDALVTRAQMAGFLARALNLTATSGIDFRDDDGHTFESAIERLAAAGVTKGCTATRFCPDAYVTRGQMAGFLARALNLKATSGIDFRDDDGHTFELAIERLAAAGVTNGCSATRFCPDAYVTRAQMAAFIKRGVFS